jgi:FixJ family two-component response regulator
MMGTQAIVYIVDDDAAICDSLASIVSSMDLEPSCFACAEDFLDELDMNVTGCILLDMYMPGIDGLECQAELLKRNATMPIIFLTGLSDVATAVHALKKGAFDYVQKPMLDQSALVERVNEAVHLHASQRASADRLEEKEKCLARLTQREREVIDLVSTGMMNKVIACELGISERTVEVHRRHAFQKLGIRNVVQLVELQYSSIVKSGLPTQRMSFS